MCESKRRLNVASLMKVPYKNTILCSIYYYRILELILDSDAGLPIPDGGLHKGQKSMSMCAF